MLNAGVAAQVSIALDLLIVYQIICSVALLINMIEAVSPLLPMRYVCEILERRCLLESVSLVRLLCHCNYCVWNDIY